MKKLVKGILIIFFFSLGIIACENESPVESASQDLSQNILDKQSINNLSNGDLTEEIEQGLVFMREEEKLARDVYSIMYSKYNLKVFQNIIRSEQTHTDAIKILLERYSLEDPVINDAIGVFQNTDLKILYAKLVDLGYLSEIDALKTGCAIEEIDILDLQKHIAGLSNNDDIKYDYENLMSASEKHLQAFVKNLKSRIINYEPQYLDQNSYNAIIN